MFTLAWQTKRREEGGASVSFWFSNTHPNWTFFFLIKLVKYLKELILKSHAFIPCYSPGYDGWILAHGLDYLTQFVMGNKIADIIPTNLNRVGDRHPRLTSHPFLVDILPSIAMLISAAMVLLLSAVLLYCSVSL